MAATVAYGLVGFFVVPPIAKNLIIDVMRERTGREVTVGEVRCNPFALSLTVRDFSMPDRPGSVFFSFDEFYANAELSSLFRWAATVKELRIEGPYVALRRFDDGVVNVLELMDDLTTGKPESDDEGGLPRALLQHMHVIDARIDIEDRYRPEPLLWELGPSQVELAEISTIPERKGSNDVVVRMPDGGTLSVNGTVVVEPLGLAGALSLENATLERLWEAVDYLFDFELKRGDLDLDLEYAVGLEDDGLHLTVDGLDVSMTEFGFRWKGHDVELLEIEAIRVAGGHLEWPEQDVVAESLVIQGVTAFAWIEPDGTPSWDVLVPETTQKQIVETYRTLEERINATARLGRFELRGAGAEFEDRTFDEPILFVVRDANLAVTDITTEEGSRWPFEAEAVFAESAAARAAGTFGASPLALDAEVGLGGLELGKYQPYVARFAPLDLKAGVLDVSGVARASKGPDAEDLDATFEGRFGVEGLNLDETVTGGRLLGWGDLEVAGIEATLQPMSARVADVDVHGAGIDITIAEDGTVNLLEFFKAMGGTEGGDGASGAPAEGGLPPVAIARFRLHDCWGRFTDNTVEVPFVLALEPVNGTVTGISTTGTSAAELDIEGDISSGGLVRLGGSLDLLDSTRFADLGIDIRDVALPPLSPMSVKFIGHPIAGGNVSLDLDYDIADRYLTARNRIEADDLILGDKVEGEGLVNLPFKLGVSLLKDKEGRIALDVPFEGSFDTPGFGIAAAAGAATKVVFSEIVKSPFKLLGKLGGGSDDQDLEYVEFAAGSSVLDEYAAAKLETLVNALNERPALAMGVVGASDPEADATALRTASFNDALVAGGVAQEQVDTPAPIEILEGLYGSTVSEPTLEAVRSRHTAPDAADPAAAGVLDDAAYRRALTEALIAAQPVDPAAVVALGPARAEAIRARLVDVGGLDASRVSLLPVEAAGDDGGDWVRCRLELEAG